MTRFTRFLTGKEGNATANLTATAAAPPPEAVALESDFVVVLAVLLCALISVVGLIAAARCAIHRRNSNNAAASGSAYPKHCANKGLKKKVLQSLPKFTYTSSSTTDGMNNCVKLPTSLSTECAICLAEFEEGEEVRMLPNCGHAFHMACIDKWLGSHSSCPSCRQVVVVGRCGKCGHSLPSTTTASRAPESASPCTTVNNTFLP